MRTKPDPVFRLARTQDPFTSGNPYLMALMDLPPAQRKVIVRQVTLLCMAIEGLDPMDALQLLAAVSPFVGGDPPL
ncbi:MAG: hypothetical protein ACPLUL_05955 [Thermanaerothrix sp.]|uniref:hypothetical protein n=1 Tax=Thermanaerothrix sp. TaxID=2972675 RepID=UPI003C7A42C8